MGLKLENDNYNDFNDSKYVTIEEEKKLKKKFTIIMIIALVLGTLIFIDILVANYTSVGPFLAIKVKTHNDGGTKEYYGLGYKVIKYRVKDGRNTTVVGNWFIKYDPKSKATTVEELGISFRNNTKETLKTSYKQFFMVTGKIDSIDKTNKKIVLIYEDKDGGNYTTKAEFYLKDISKLNNYNKGDTITINGTFMKYTPKKNNIVRTITFTNCSISNNISDKNSDAPIKYRLITDKRLTTLLNDGGTHKNQYYEIDFENKKVIKYEDSYDESKGYSYKRKILYEKKLSEDEVKKLQNFIEIIKNEKDKIDYSTSDYRYYILLPMIKPYKNYNNYNNSEELEKYVGSILYNNYEVINSIEELLKSNLDD